MRRRHLLDCLSNPMSMEKQELMMLGEISGKLDGVSQHLTRQDGRLDNIDARLDRKSTRLNSSHIQKSRMPSSA